MKRKYWVLTGVLTVIISLVIGLLSRSVGYEALSDSIDINMGLKLKPSKVLVTRQPLKLPITIENYSEKERQIKVALREPFVYEDGYKALDNNDRISVAQDESVIQAGSKIAYTVEIEKISDNKEVWLSVQEVVESGLAQELILKILINGKTKK